MWQRLPAPLRDLDLMPRWIDGYGRGEAQRDALAGLTVGVMLVPQSMAYAVIAGVPPIYGLYAALVPLLVYPLLGTARQLSTGPVAIDMLIVAAGVSGMAAAGSPRYALLAVALAMMAGAAQIAMGLGRLGFVADFISRPVVDGFTAAAALIIGFSQLGNLLGLDLARSEYVYVLLREAAGKLGQVHAPTAAMGLGCVLVIVVVQRWKPVFPSALAVAAGGTLAAWALDLPAEGVAVVGAVPTGLPALRVPLPGLSEVSADDLRRLLPTALTLALVQFMSVVSLSRVFAAKHRYAVDANRELLAVGAANFVGSLFRSLPVSGSFSRSAVNDQAGARSPLANVFAALLVGAALLFLTPLLFYLPMPALAAIIVVAAAGLIDLQEIRTLFRIRRREGAIALLTFVSTLVIGIQEGILLGVTASVIGVLYHISRPQMAELGHLPGSRFFKDFRRRPQARSIDGMLVLRVNAAFSFANAEFFKEFILEKSHVGPSDLRVVILDGASINDLDTTAVEALSATRDALREEGIELHFTGLIGPVRDLFRRAGLREQFGPDHFHLSPHEAVIAILEAWDAEDDGRRLDHYWRVVERGAALEEVPIQSGKPQSERGRAEPE